MVNSESYRKTNNNIAVFMPNFSAGGAEKVTINLVNEFLKRGIYLDLIVIEAKGPYLDLLSKEVKIFDLSESSFITKLGFRFLKPIILPYFLAKYLQRRNIHLLVTSLHLPTIISLIVKKYFFKKIKIIIFLHCSLKMELSKQNLRNRIIAKIAKSLLPIADSIVTVSQDLEEEIKSHIPSVARLLQTIYNPIDISYISRQATKTENLSHPWIDRQSYRIILTVGRLVLQKDLTTLIKAFAEVIRSCSSSRLIILGEGPEKSRLKDLARRLKVHGFIDFVGFQHNPYSWMAKADVFVLSSLYEGLPSVLIEAMACETQVVSTNCPHGAGEILQNGTLGRLVPVGNHKQLAHAILDTLHRPTSSNLLKERAKDFSIPQAIEAYDKLFQYFSRIS